MPNNYYDLDDILADAEKLPCRFELTVPGLGYLEGNPGKSIKKDTKLELPLWMAEFLATCLIMGDESPSFIRLEEPDFLNPKVLNAIKSNATSVDIHSILPNFYKLIEKWSTMFGNTELIEITMQMLNERSFEINNYASNTNKNINSNFLFSLDEFEKYLFKVTTENNKHMRRWINED
ncbi:DNA replication complex GINS protein PSF3 [Hyphopichia burtonii NRRL Y-1933]|uniref:DNA replication complex GINS protein PSF3 n=1 Tax=Hyphopichia burtonii NRRL Y-1933 TaxID=984485 RepID=A0A1E4RRW2_9ASCO|nr:DNA replication complex GINS protein PSF3 [Hyphopichia burtonii NRRL Y-1933]ODV69987.1 DNA replication complex GINS protein PSF3 [Hyphopichia burtonii NRRL Y-1933]